MIGRGDVCGAAVIDSNGGDVAVIIVIISGSGIDYILWLYKCWCAAIISVGGGVVMVVILVLVLVWVVVFVIFSVDGNDIFVVPCDYVVVALIIVSSFWDVAVDCVVVVVLLFFI